MPQQVPLQVRVTLQGLKSRHGKKVFLLSGGSSVTVTAMASAIYWPGVGKFI